MRLKFLLIFCVYCIVEIYAGCLCRNSGTSVCSCDPTYVRPQAKPEVLSAKSTICRTVGAQEFKPIGDVCSCGNVKVAPARGGQRKLSGERCASCRQAEQRKTQPGRDREPDFYNRNDKTPRPRLQSGNRNRNDNIENAFRRSQNARESVLQESERETVRTSQRYNHYDIAGTPFDEAVNIYEEKREKIPDPQADSISIVLAAEQRDRCVHKVPEAKLHYGAVGKIEDGSLKKKVPDLKEGALYKLAGTRLSLKKCRKQEAEDETEDQEEEEQDADDIVVHSLGYDQIGYSDTRFNNPRYIKEYTRPKSTECNDDKNVYEIETVEKSDRTRESRRREYSRESSLTHEERIHEEEIEDSIYESK